MLNFPIISQSIMWLEKLATQMPITWFVLIGSIAEEILSPIPSPLVLTLAGSIAASQNKSFLYLIILAFIGSIGKTFASWIFYILADKTEDLLNSRFGRLFGVDNGQIEKIGAILNRYQRKTLILTLIRAFPASPSLPVSLLCGFIKLDMKSYLVSTYFGYLLRNVFYLYVGYIGMASITGHLNNAEGLIKILFVITAIALTIFLYYQRSRGKSLTDILDDKK